MSEAVEILIEADDKASATIKNVGDNVEKTVKGIGGKAKASTELVGTLANALGGTQIGGYASQLAQLTERISAFSEVAKAGGAGALAFKAGLVAAAGVVTYNVATELASWYFEADKWRQAMEDGEKAARRAIDAMDRARSKRFSNDREEMLLIRDPAKREAAINKRASELENQASQMRGEALADMRDSLYQEAEALRDLVSERTKSIQARKEENAAIERSDSYVAGLREQLQLIKAVGDERFALEAAKMAQGPEAQAEAKRLLKELDAEEKKQLAQKEAERQREADRKAAEAEHTAELKRIEQVRERERESLEKQRIELTKGKEAAHAFGLEMEGLDKSTAKMFASAQATLDLQKAQTVDKSEGQSAMSSRLLRFGRGGDQQTQLLQEINAVLNLIKKSTEDVAENTGNKLPLSSRTYQDYPQVAVIP